MRPLLPVFAAMIILALVACRQTQPQGFGSFEQIKEAGDNDVARALGMQLWKYEYRLPPGVYETDVWLEQWDQNSTSPKRLTYGRGSSTKETDGGNLIFSIMDPATTTSERGQSWRVGISKKERTFQSWDTPVILDPLQGVPGGRIHGSQENGSFKIREEVILITWAGGSPATASNVHRHNISTNARTVYLKLKVTPYEETPGGQSRSAPANTP